MLFEEWNFIKKKIDKITGQNVAKKNIELSVFYFQQSTFHQTKMIIILIQNNDYSTHQF